ncbi:MAG: hypothetical protein ACO3A2_08480 [Bdellovibrionia bacterium]
MDLFLILAAGLIGTSLMFLVMGCLHRLHWTEVDLVRSIGGLYTRSRGLATLLGLVGGYGAGFLFSFLYARAAWMAPFVSPGTVLMICAVLSLVQGILVGLFFEAVIAEFHPLDQFRTKGFAVVLGYTFVHLFYGLGLGSVFAFALIQNPSLRISVNPGESMLALGGSGSEMGPSLIGAILILLFLVGVVFFLPEKKKTEGGAQVTDLARLRAKRIERSRKSKKAG